MTGKTTHPRGSSIRPSSPRRLRLHGGDAPRAPQPLKPVDLARFYTGTWREIGRRPMSLTDGCVAGATEYKRVSDTMPSTCATPARRIRPPAPPRPSADRAPSWTPEPTPSCTSPTDFFGFIPIGRDYWVLDHARRLQLVHLRRPGVREPVDIHPRSAHVGPAERQRLIDRAKALGYDTSKLEFPAQPEPRHLFCGKLCADLIPLLSSGAIMVER